MKYQLGVAQSGSAPSLGDGCRRFDSSHPDHNKERHVHYYFDRHLSAVALVAGTTSPSETRECRGEVLSLAAPQAEVADLVTARFRPAVSRQEIYSWSRRMRRASGHIRMAAGYRRLLSPVLAGSTGVTAAIRIWACSSVGRASALQAECRRFDAGRVHHLAAVAQSVEHPHCKRTVAGSIPCRRHQQRGSGRVVQAAAFQAVHMGSIPLTRSTSLLVRRNGGLSQSTATRPRSAGFFYTEGAR